MKSIGISILNKMEKSELIEEIRSNQFYINQLEKEIKKQSFKWREYYSKKEYRQQPEVKAKRRDYIKRPEVKAKRREYRQQPEVKAKRRDYIKRPEVKAKQKIYWKEYSQRPEVKAKKEIYWKEYHKKNKNDNN